MIRNSLGTLAFLADRPRPRSGQTPHVVIHSENKACVRYFPPAKKLLPPVFVSMPLINTWTVFDLVPGRSVVEALVQAGVPVYLLDWGRAGREDQDRPMAYYTDQILGRAIERSCRHAAVQQMDAVGYCVGGTFLAIHLSRFAERIRRVAFLATPIDFAASGRLALWARPESFPLDAIVDGFGNFPAETMVSSFRWLKPQGQSAKWVGLWERIDEEGFPELWEALERWNADGVDFPGETYREYVRACYFENRLMTGGWTMAARPVDLGAAKIPALSLATSEDHIVPPPAAHALEKVWGGPVTTKTLRGGHVGVCIGKALPTALLGWMRDA